MKITEERVTEEVDTEEKNREKRKRNDSDNNKSRSRGRKHSFLAWIAGYTACFLIVGSVIWYPFYQEKRSFIWGYDGLYQTYTTMVYYSQYWKDVIRSIFAGEAMLPMVDTTVGLGFDVFTSLNHYGFGDPLEILSLFFTAETMEICYALLVVLRYYLAGLAFGAYGFYMKKRGLPVLAGAMAYCFCGFALYAGVRHPYFMNSLIYFPILLIGVEEILRKKRGYLLSIMVGIAACSNFYFLYMLTLLTFLYAVIRFLSMYAPLGRSERVKAERVTKVSTKVSSRPTQKRGLYGRKRWKKEFISCLSSGCLWYFLGIALGAVFLLPNILAFLGNARSSIDSGFANTWFAYPKEFYKQLITGYLFPEYSAQYWCVLGYSPVVLLGIFSLTQKRRRENEKWIGVWLIALTLLLWLPFGGYLMNGFSYVSHRWMYGYSFCMAWILMLGIERVKECSKKDCSIYIGILTVASIWYLVNKESLGNQSGTLLVFLVSSLIVVGLVFYKKGIRLGQAGLTLCVIGTVISSASWLYQEEGMHYTAEFEVAGNALDTMTQPSEAQWEKEIEEIHKTEKREKGEKETNFYRIEGDTISDANYGMITGTNGTNPFFSIVGNDVYAYMKALENPDAKFPNWYNGMGDRAGMMSLASVRYFAKQLDSTMQVPFGYEEVDSSEKGILYENSYAMPLGYTYDAVMERETWDTLSALQKQQALMQSAVLEVGEMSDFSSLQGLQGVTASNVSRLTADSCVFEETELPYQISRMDNLIWNQESGELIVKEGGGSMELEFVGEEGAETYVRVCNFDTDGSGHELLYFFVGNQNGDEAKKIYVTSDLSVWDGKFKNYLTAVGNGNNLCKGAKLSFPFAGTFHLSGIEVYSLPMEGFVQQTEERKSESLDTNVIGNRIQGEITVSSDKILCLSLPYSEGWTAKVDGEEVAVWKCNGMFMGIFLPEGSHQLEFSYRTPGILVGFWISMSALCVMGGSLWYAKREKK